MVKVQTLKKRSKKATRSQCAAGTVKGFTESREKTMMPLAAGTASGSWVNSVCHQPCVLSTLLAPHCGTAVCLFLMLWGYNLFLTFCQSHISLSSFILHIFLDRPKLWWQDKSVPGPSASQPDAEGII